MENLPVLIWEDILIHTTIWVSHNDRLSETGRSQKTIYDSTNMRLLDIQTGRGEERTQDGRCKVLEINGNNSTQL